MTSSRGGAPWWGCCLPVGDEAAVGDLGLFGEFALAGAFGALAVGVLGGEVSSSGSACGAGAQFDRAELLAGQRGALEGVVLLAGEEVPEEHGEFARNRDDRDLAAATNANALVEGAHRSRRVHGDVRGFGEHVADLSGALLGDPSLRRGAAAGRADLGVKPQVADQLAGIAKAANVADGGD